MSKVEIAQIITASATALIALLALFLAIYEGHQARKHYRLSLKPKLVLDISKSNYPTTVVAKIINSGLGPTCIKSMKIVISGKEIDGGVEEEFEKELDYFLSSLHIQQKAIGILNPGYVVRATQEFQVAKIVLASDEECSPKYLVEKLSAIDVAIEFESFYGEPDKYDSRTRQAGTH